MKGKGVKIVVLAMAFIVLLVVSTLD